MSKENGFHDHFDKAWAEAKRGTQGALDSVARKLANTINTVLGLPVPVIYRETASSNVGEAYTAFILPPAKTRRQKIIASMLNVIEKPDMDDPVLVPLEGTDWLRSQEGVQDAFVENNGSRLIVLGTLPRGYEEAVSYVAKTAAPFVGRLALIRDVAA